MRVWLLSCLLAAWLSSPIFAAERPNFVWILSEDNSKHFLRHFDPAGAPAPQIEALAKEGLTFDGAFSNSPVCSVARTTLITSCYAPRIGTFHHRNSFLVPMPEGVRMFPAYLREAGYYTTNNAKKDYNAKEGPGVWDESSRQATWRKRAPGQPFFHMHTIGTTHEGSLHFPESDITEKPTQTDPAGVKLAPYHPDTETFRYTYARYHDNIQTMDRQVGRLVAQLEEDGLLDTTFIFYFGDHGGVLPRSKGYAYDTGLHVPLVIRLPEKFRDRVDLPAGSRPERFVSFIDFGPTVLNLAGVQAPGGIDGRPFLGPGSQAMADNDESLGYADRFDEKYDMVRTLRKGRYRYVRNFQGFNFDGLMNNYRYQMAAYRDWRSQYDAGRLDPVQSQFFRPRPPEQLFDVAADPYETHNLAEDPQHQQTLQAMRARLNQILADLPDLGFFPEPYLADVAAEDPVRFGQQHQAEIARLLEIANLQLLPFDEAKTRIAEALDSPDPWQRYWGLIVCTAHGPAAADLAPQIQTLGTSDASPLVRTRAAEYLGLYTKVDPRPILKAALERAQTATEANLILNTVVLLQDGPSNHPFTLTPQDVAHVKGDRTELDRRLEYLTSK